MESSGGSKSEKVLIVDDDRLVRGALERQMAALGLQTLSAGGGARGLALLELSKPDFVLLDLRMPGMDGHAFLQELAKRKPRAAVIVLSGDATVRDRVDVLIAGAVQFVRKPWSEADLVAALERGRKRLAASPA